jgi:hypothetical protein
MQGLAAWQLRSHRLSFLKDKKDRNPSSALARAASAPRFFPF